MEEFVIDGFGLVPDKKVGKAKIKEAVLLISFGKSKSATAKFSPEAVTKMNLKPEEEGKFKTVTFCPINNKSLVGVFNSTLSDKTGKKELGKTYTVKLSNEETDLIFSVNGLTNKETAYFALELKMVGTQEMFILKPSDTKPEVRVRTDKQQLQDFKFAKYFEAEKKAGRKGTVKGYWEADTKADQVLGVFRRKR